MISTIITAVLSIALGVLSHKIYTELYGVKFNIKNWKVLVKEDPYDAFVLTGESEDGRTILLTLNGNDLDFYYARSK